MSLPEFADEMLKWAGTNKDALLVLGAFLAAFLAPVTAIIAAAVSYRAVVTGPREALNKLESAGCHDVAGAFQVAQKILANGPPSCADPNSSWVSQI